MLLKVVTAIPKIFKFAGTIIQKVTSFGSKALGKAKNFVKNFSKGKGKEKIPDNVDQIKQEEPPDPTKETPVQDALEKMPETEGEKEGQEVAKELDRKAEVRAAHAGLLYSLGSNLDGKVNEMNLQGAGNTADLVNAYKGKDGEPDSAVSALDNTGKILDNQQQIGDTLKLNSQTLAEIARTQADSDMTEALSNRMDAMQEALKEQMGQAQEAMNAQNAQNAQANQGFMQKLGSGIKNTMGLLQGMADKKDKMMAFKEALKEFVYDWGKNFGFIFEGVKILFEKIPIMKWLKKGIGAVTGVITKHVWPAIKKIPAGLKWLGKKIAAGFKKALKFVIKVIDIVTWLVPPIAAIKLAVKGIMAAVKFFSKSKEERQQEIEEKKAAVKNFVKKIPGAKQAANYAKAGFKVAKKVLHIKDKEPDAGTEIPSQDELAKEGGVDVGKVETEGVTEPAPVASEETPEENTEEDSEDDAEDEGSEGGEGEEDKVDEKEAELVDVENSEAESPGEVGGGTADMINDAKDGSKASDKSNAKPDFNPSSFRGMDKETKFSALSSIAAGKFGMSRDRAYEWMMDGKIQANSKGYLILNKDVVPNATLAADSTKFSTYAEAQKELSARQAATAQERDSKIDQALDNKGDSTAIQNSTINIYNQPKDDAPSRYDNNL